MWTKATSDADAGNVSTKMRTTVDLAVRLAPPDRAAAILTEIGYPVSGKTLRYWYKKGRIPGCDTGKRVLLNIEKIIEYFETGDPAEGKEDIVR